jgi:hypothetical protein
MMSLLLSYGGIVEYEYTDQGVVQASPEPSKLPQPAVFATAEQGQ